MPAAHAPVGGTTIRGKHYRGGEFIPAEVVDSLSDDETDKAGLKTGPEDDDETDDDFEPANDTITVREARDNAKRAVRIAKTAQRQLRKLGRMKK